MLQFPDVLLNFPIFENAILACEGKTEASPQFICGSVLAAASTIIGRKFGVKSFPSPLYPNMFIVLCGASGGSKKSSSLKFAELLLERVGHPVMIIKDLATPEGLVRNFGLPLYRQHGGEWDFPQDILDEENQDKREEKMYDFIAKNSGKNPIGADKYVDYTHVNEMLKQSNQSEGFRGIAIIDEFAGTLKKAKKDSSDGLMQRLSEFYGNERLISNSSSGSPVRAVNPCLNLLTAIPVSWLNRNLTMEDIEGGLGRRLQFICDSQTPDVAFPDGPDEKYLARVVVELQNVRYPDQKHYIYDFNDEAKELLTEIYAEHKYRIRSTDRDDIKAVIEGHDQQLRKAATLFTALDEGANPVITTKHLSLANQWINFVYDCQKHIFGQFSYTEMDANEKRIIKWLSTPFRKTGQEKGWQEPRDIYRGVTLDAETGIKALKNLEAIGILECKTEDINDSQSRRKQKLYFCLREWLDNQNTPF